MRSRGAIIGTIIAASLATLLAGCEPKAAPNTAATVRVEARKSDTWRAIASGADRDRIDRLDSAWSSGLAEARTGGFRSAIDSEGKLLVAASAQPRPAPTPGSYRCRLVTLGKAGGKGPAFEKFKPFFCYIAVEDELFTIVKQTGSQRPAGRLWDDDVATRLVYLGSLALGNEEEALAYGDDPKRDMAGVFERIEPFRWRLVIPYPQDGAKLDVFELTPVAEQPKA